MTTINDGTLREIIITLETLNQEDLKIIFDICREKLNIKTAGRPRTYISKLVEKVILTKKYWLVRDAIREVQSLDDSIKRSQIYSRINYLRDTGIIEMEGYGRFTVVKS